MNLNMKGLRAIVTGGSRGIGKATIDNFVSQGMMVATCSRGVESLNESLSTWNKSGTHVYGEAVDVTDAKAYEAWFHRAVKQLGGVDIIVSNVSTRIETHGLERWQDTFEVDLLQHVRTTNIAIPYLKQSESASIVYVGSVASIMNNNSPSELEYGAMKAALVSYAGQLAHQIGPEGIRVNLVSPGPIHHKEGFWEMVKNNQPDLYERVSSASVFNRMGTVEEVANSITFLSSPAASNVTAANLRVDGGCMKTANF